MLFHNNTFYSIKVIQPWREQKSRSAKVPLNDTIAYKMNTIRKASPKKAMNAMSHSKDLWTPLAPVTYIANWT